MKGWHAHELVDNPARLRRPLVRRGDDLVEASWEEAVGRVSDGLGALLQSGGPQAVGVLGCAGCPNEDNYVLVRFARAILGTANIDCSARANCLSEWPANGPATGGQIADLDDSDLIVLVGADPGEEHPAVGARVYRARERGARVVTVSVRRHALARLADLHLSVRPGTELAWAGSFLHVLLIEREQAGREAEQLTGLVTSLAGLSAEAMAATTGIPAADLRRLTDLYQSSEKVTILHASGLALSRDGSEVAKALSTLAWLGKHGIGPKVVLLNLLSRSNLRGCCDMGVAPDYLPGYVALEDEAGAARLERTWDGPFARGRGLQAWEMIGDVQGLYVVGDDLSRGLPDWAATREALAKLKLLVVQDIFLGPVASLAHVVLPAAAFAERDGSWTNLEGRVQRSRAAVQATGEALPDWRILVEVSRALGKPLPYESAEQIFAEIAKVVPAYGGMTYDSLTAQGGTQATGDAAAAAGPLVPDLAGANNPPEVSEQFPLLLAADPSLRPWDDEATVSHTLTASACGRAAPRGLPLPRGKGACK